MSLVLIVTLFATLLAGCASQATTTALAETAAGETTAAPAAKTDVKITFLNSKGEITAQLEEAAKAFTAETGIEMEIIPCPAGTSP